MSEYLDDYISNLAKKLETEAKNSPENREAHYMAARLLMAFNDLFAVTWKDVEYAEQMRRDLEEDKKKGGHRRDNRQPGRTR